MKIMQLDISSSYRTYQSGCKLMYSLTRVPDRYKHVHFFVIPHLLNQIHSSTVQTTTCSSVPVYYSKCSFQ